MAKVSKVFWRSASGYTAGSFQRLGSPGYDLAVNGDEVAARNTTTSLLLPTRHCSESNAKLSSHKVFMLSQHLCRTPVFNNNRFGQRVFGVVVYCMGTMVLMFVTYSGFRYSEVSEVKVVHYNTRGGGGGGGGA